jgi:hypothetical protein
MFQKGFSVLELDITIHVSKGVFSLKLDLRLKTLYET